MAWDEGLAQNIRDNLAGEPVTERRMFGGLAFLRGGHMVAGIHRGCAFFRVGRAQEAAALSMSGVAPMAMAGRPMPGMVIAADDAVGDDAARSRLLALALGFVRGLPPKKASR